MVDEITQNPASVETPSETDAEMPQIEAPAVGSPEPAPITPEPQTAQMGVNEPLAPATMEVSLEPVAMQTPAPETLEPTISTEISQPPPSEPLAPTEVVAPIVVPVVAQTFGNSIRELFTKAQLAIQNRKRKKIDRVMTLFAKQTSVTNNEVEKLLHISDATATRYLSTLAKEGRIKQNGKTGKGVSYSKI